MSASSKAGAGLRFDTTLGTLAFSWLAIVLLVVSYLWLFSSAGWLHVELITAPEYIWTPPRDLSFLSQLRTLFDWAAFDSSPYRLRLLSDFLEVLDSISRPKFVWLLGLHPSATPASLLLAALTVICVYKALRYFGLTAVEAAFLTAIFATTVGFLSCFVSYIRPAKKVALFCMALSLFLIFRFIKQGDSRGFKFALSAVLATLFTDEAGYAFYGIAGFFLVPALAQKRLWKHVAAFAAVLPVFLILAKGILPTVYSTLGTSGPRSQVVPSRLILDLLEYLVEPRFYAVSIEELSRAAFGALGLARLKPDLSAGFVVVFAGSAFVALYLLLRSRGSDSGKTSHWQLIAATASVFAMGFFLTLINWFSAPFGYNYYGSMSYYYYSPVALLAVVWLAATVKLVRERIVDLQKKTAFTVLVALLAISASIQNYRNFVDLNALIQTIHIFPLDPAALRSAVRTLPAVVANLPPKAPIPIELIADREGLEEAFYPLSRSVLGRRAGDADKNLAHFLKHPLGTEAYVRAYVRAFYPRREVAVRIVDKK